MKRINIYITPETDKIITNMAKMFGESRSEVIRKSITEYTQKHETEINHFMQGLDQLIEPPKKIPRFNITEEFIKCKDIEYFMRNYIKINTVDSGIVQFEPYHHQVALAESYSMYRRILVNHSRQMGVSVTTCASILHGLLFEDCKTYVIMNIKQQSAEYTLDILKTMINELPEEFKSLLEIDTLSKNRVKVNSNYVIATSMNSDSVRGMTINFLYIEHFSYAQKQIADRFITSILPTILSSNTSKVIITSSPNGPNHFYKIWSDAISDYNGFHPIILHYSLFKDKEKVQLYKSHESIIGPLAFREEYDCKFNIEHRGILHGV